jgi:integrase
MSSVRVFKTSDGAWAIRFADPKGELRPVPDKNGRRHVVVRTLRWGDTKDMADAIASRVKVLVDRVVSRDPLPRHVAEWVDSLAPARRAKLAGWGLITTTAAAASDPIGDHVEAFERHLISRGTEPRRVADLCRRVRTVLSLAKIGTLPELQPDHVEAAIAGMVVGQGEKKRPAAPHTKRAHVGCVGQFAKWATRQRLLLSNPIAALETVKGGTQRKRRAYSQDEQHALLAAALAGPEMTWRHEDGTRTTVSGAERYRVYRTSLETGLRSNELASLTVGSFTLDATTPTVALADRSEKNRQGSTFPISLGLAGRLREAFRHKLDTAAAFNLPEGSQRVLMIRKDLAAARAVWIDLAGGDPAETERRRKSAFGVEVDPRGRVADFHSLRNSFISNWAFSGAPLAVVSKKARHSDVNLTLRVYADLGIIDQPERPTPLPDYDAPTTRQAARATGTDGEKSTRALRGSGANLPDVSASDPDTERGADAENPLKISVFRDKREQLRTQGDSRLGELNSRPALYKSAALPLS